MLWIEFLILLTCIVIGARLGGIGLGTVSGIGLLLFIFVFKLPPGSPPTIVLFMILAVITALSSMQAAGGLDFLVAQADKIMRKRPQQITFIAPLVSYVLVFASGTQHVLYAVLPVISEVSTRAGIRPERPMSISVIAAQHGLIASPISAATVAMVGALAGYNVGLIDIVKVIIPATLLGVLVGTLVVMRKGKELDQDPEYQKRLAEGKIILPEPNAEEPSFSKESKLSLVFFFVAILSVVTVGLFPDLRPIYQSYVGEGEYISAQVSMDQAIMVIMFAVAGLMMLVCKSKPIEAVKSATMRSGIIAVISIMGVSWLGSSFFAGNEEFIVSSIADTVQNYPWVFAIGLFILSMLLFSQAATVVTLMPVAIAIGLPAETLIGVYPAVNGYFFLPTYGTILAAVSFDQTGTTRIGKYLVNHSFMLPGMVVTISSTIFALILSKILM